MTIPPNAKVLRIDLAGAPSVSGDVAYVAGPAISLPCIYDEPTSSQKYVLGDGLRDVSAVVYAWKTELAAAGVAEIPVTAVLTVLPDGESAPLTLEVLLRKDRVSPRPGLSHWELYAKAR